MTAGTWPHLLEEVLNQQNLGIKFSVINRGVSGTTSEIILSQLEGNLNRYNPDMVIAMMGINDGEDTGIYKDISSPKRIMSYFKNFRVYKLIKLLWLHIINKAGEVGAYIPKGKNGIIEAEDFIQPDTFKEQEENKDAIKINTQGTNKELAASLTYQGDFDKAEKILREVIAMNSQDDMAYVELGINYELRGDKYDMVVEAYKKAIEINSRNAKAYFQLGLYYEHSGEYERAVEMYKKAVEINPQDRRSHSGLGICYRKLGQYNKAEEIYKRAIETSPDDDMAYGGLALCYKEQRKSNLSEEYFRKANEKRFKKYNHITRDNYNRLWETVNQRGIKLACMQYPLRSVESLKKMFKTREGIIFIDNEKIFKETLKTTRYEDYFIDSFAGDFGHCTERGNRVLSGNIAKVILREYFDKDYDKDKINKNR